MATLIAATKIGLRCFAAGALLAAVTAGLAYMTNALYAGAAAAYTRSFDHPFVKDNPESVRKSRWAVALNWLAVATIIGSYVVFGFGLWKIAERF